MLELLGLLAVGTVALKVFKKSSPNGKLTVYLGKRDFVDHLGQVDPIDGVVVVDTDYLQGRKVFGLVNTTFRYGRESDETMGLKFSKEMCLGFSQVHPAKTGQSSVTPLQDKLIKKLGANAFPFFFELPPTSPTSVTLQPGSMDSGKPLGVEYDLKTWIAENKDEKPHRRSSVSMAIRKVQFAPVDKSSRQPSAIVSKGFALASGKINLEVTLDKDIYYHGERITANVRVSNNSRKTVRCFKVGIIQHCEVTVVNAQFSREVASLQTKEGCPITPGATLTKQFFLTPVAGDNKKKEGIALDGRVKDEDANLASSTLLPPGDNGNNAYGIIVSYTLRVRLNCGYLGGEIEADLPFKLLHPAPGSDAEMRVKAERKARKLEAAQQMSRDTDDDDPNIVFEDFKRARSIDIAD